MSSITWTPAALGSELRPWQGALWRAVERWPSVEQREGFAVHELLRDAEEPGTSVLPCHFDGMQAARLLPATSCTYGTINE